MDLRTSGIGAVPTAKNNYILILSIRVKAKESYYYTLIIRS